MNLKTQEKSYATNMERLPYEKFLSDGPQSLTNAELLAIIIRTGTKENTPVMLGEKILELSNGKQKGLLGLHHVSIQDLMSIQGIGEVKAVKIKCVTEFSRRIAKDTFLPTVKFDKPNTVAEYYMEEMRHHETEQVLLVMTDNKNQLIKELVISQGTVNQSMLSSREIFIHALRYRAVYILLIHNHPSGDPTPSKADIQITKQINEAATLLNIPLMDHIIIGDHQYRSMRELGLL
ncbi:MAG: DNA repair protein RadC [Eubacteriales bacterium]